MKIGKVFASAGCGKTTRLLQITEHLFNQGTKPHEIMFTTFTRSGAYEAQERAMLKFGYKESQFPYFRTLHSICYRACNMPPLMTIRDYIHIGKKLNCRFGGVIPSAEPSDLGKGDAMLSLYNLQKNRMQKHIHPHAEGYNFTLQEYEHFIETYGSYKAQYGKYDYTDLIEECAFSSDPLPIQYAIVDEAQDLTPLQWEAVKRLAARARWLWLAGDDDQSIYTYSGADPNILIDLRCDKLEHLEVSYRLPPALSSYANKIAQRISKREPKTIKPRASDNEELIYVGSLDQVNFSTSESTVILVRNRFLADHVAAVLRARGVLYNNNCSTEDTIGQQLEAASAWKRLYDGEALYGSDLAGAAKYITAIVWRKHHRAILKESDVKVTYDDLVKDHGLLKKGDWWQVLKLPQVAFLKKHWDGRPPSCAINTIHTFKGKEVDHAVVLSDISALSHNTLQKNPDSEHRVFFVAVTRAKKKLTLVRPMTDKYYPL